MISIIIHIIRFGIGILLANEDKTRNKHKIKQRNSSILIPITTE